LATTKGLSQIVTPDLQGYIVFTYTFHLWGDKKENRAGLTKSGERVAGAK
jgi:hypothetical protein